MTIGTEAVRSDSMQFFTGVAPDYYWTSALQADGGALACDMVYSGCGITNMFANYYYVLPVRSDN